MLFGAAPVIALMRDRDDDAGLVVLPAMGRDAGALAQGRAARRRPRPAGLPRSASPSAKRDGHRIARGSRSSSPRCARSATPSASQALTSASIRKRFSTMCANGCAGRRPRHSLRPAGRATSPANVRNTGRITSSSRLSVTIMSRIGCAFGATVLQMPSASNRFLPAAMIAEARGSRLGRVASAGSATTISKRRPRPLRKCERQREAGKAAAADDDALLFSHLRNLCPGAGSPPTPCHGCGPLRDIGSILGAVARRRPRNTDVRRAASNCSNCSISSRSRSTCFAASARRSKWPRVFGGQVIGQAMVAACRTVERNACRTRCTPISSCPAIRPCRSSTRSAACATDAASPRAA